MSEEKTQNIQPKEKDQAFKKLLAASPSIIKKLEASLCDSTNYFPSSKTNATSFFKEKINSIEFLCSILHFFLGKENPPNAIKENAHYQKLISGKGAETIPIKSLTTIEQDTDNADMYLADVLKIKPVTIQFLTDIIPNCINYINKPEHAEGHVAYLFNCQSTEKILRNTTLNLIEFMLNTIQIFKEEFEKNGSRHIQDEKNFIIMKYALENMWNEINPDIKDPNNPMNSVHEEHIQNLKQFIWEIPNISSKHHLAKAQTNAENHNKDEDYIESESGSESSNSTLG